MKRMTRMTMKRDERGFTITELAVAIGIMGVLAMLMTAAVLPAVKKGRDVKRKATVVQVGKFLAARGCYMPALGPGSYDLGEILPEVQAAFPQYGAALTAVPKDPKGGTDAVTKYRYAVTPNGEKCVLYANLEYENERVTLTGLSDPTPGGGAGVVAGSTVGPNGTTLYFQVSN